MNWLRRSGLLSFFNGHSLDFLRKGDVKRSRSVSPYHDILMVCSLKSVSDFKKGMISKVLTEKVRKTGALSAVCGHVTGTIRSESLFPWKDVTVITIEYKIEFLGRWSINFFVQQGAKRYYILHGVLYKERKKRESRR